MRPYNTTHKQILKNNHKQKNCMNNRTYRKTRCSRPLSSSHTTPTHHKTNHQTAAHLQHAATCHTGTTTTRVSSQTPNSAPTTNQHKKGKHHKRLNHHTHAQTTINVSDLTSRCSTQKTKKPHATNTMTHDTKKNNLLRKEVIQPHLPVRLPCYDFVPIANPTFDSSLTSLGHWLRVLPTFMT